MKKAKELFLKLWNLAWDLYRKYEEIIVYLIVGVLTTIVSWFCMFFVNIVIFGNPLNPTSTQNLILSVVNWTAGVAFAFPTNRRFVFKSTNPHIFSELVKFIGSRLFTLFLDIGLRQLLGFMGVNVYITTFVSAVLVIIGNYIFSKLLVFRKKL
ncbi:MAG: GtrA family protein [Lachnospiraceae bacterium]|nr:GtrA family protein [Lachnospiraceae bacterium]